MVNVPCGNDIIIAVNTLNACIKTMLGRNEQKKEKKKNKV